MLIRERTNKKHQQALLLVTSRWWSRFISTATFCSTALEKSSTFTSSPQTGAPTASHVIKTTMWCTTSNKSHLVSQEPRHGRFGPDTAKQKNKAKISACTWEAGLGAMLLQHCGDRWRAPACTSRGLTSSQLNFIQTEKEPLPLLHACALFRVYNIHGHLKITSAKKVFLSSSRPPKMSDVD